MPQPSDLQRNGTGYFFARSVPGALRGVVGADRITRDLATDELQEARRRCWCIGVQIDRLFGSLQVEMSRLTAGSQEFLWRWRLMPIEDLPADWADLWFRNKMPQPLFATRSNTKLVPAAAVQEQPAPAVETAALLSEVLAVWKGELESKHLASTLSAILVRRFIEFLGDRPIADVEAKDIPRFLDAMRQMPSRPLRGAKHGTVQELMLHPEGAKRPRLSEGSIGDYRRALNSYFQWAVAFGHITQNPIHAILVRRHRVIYTPRQPFTTQELNLFFSSRAYATCAEFMTVTKELRAASAAFEFAGPHCNLRDIDLGIAVGSAAKAAAHNGIDTRCQTRIAVAARKLGLIQADVAVALSMSVTHKNPGFDNTMPAIDFAAPELAALPSTGTAPVKTPDGRWSHAPDLEPED